MDPRVNVEIPSSSVGVEVWNKSFKDEQVLLPNTNFMKKLKTLFSTDQITQVFTSIKESLVWKRKQFCDKTYASTQEVRTQLFIRFTRIMIKEAGYKIGPTCIRIAE